MTFTWRVYVRDKTLQRQGEVRDYESLKLEPAFNDIGTWTLTMDRRAAMAANLTQPGWGITVIRDGITVFSGPARKQQHRVSTTDQKLTLTGYDDNIWLQARDASPSPAEAVPPYIAQAYDVRSGVCSTVLRQYVDVNLGPGAVPARRKSGVTIGADPLAGSSVSGRARWQNLLALLQELATAGGIGFRLVQVGTSLEFQPYAPADKTGAVKFSFGLRNLEAYEYATEAPVITFARVGGGGEGTARTIYEKPNSAAVAKWERIEGEFIDRRDTTTSSELDQSATEALTDGAEKATLSISPIDTAQVSYLTSYGLGDRVTVQLDDVTIQNRIDKVLIELTPQGQTVRPQLDAYKSGPLDLLARLRNLGRRVTNLERR